MKDVLKEDSENSVIGKLLKHDKGYSLIVNDVEIAIYNVQRQERPLYSLSKENCDEIFGIINVEELSKIAFPCDYNFQGDELDYFEKTRDILIKYYQHEHKIDNIDDDMITESETLTQTSTIIDSNTITNSVSEDINNTEPENDDVLDRLSRLNEIANKNAKEKKPIKRKKNKEITTQQKSILSYLIDSDISGSSDSMVLTENNNDKGTLKEQYLSLTDNMYLCEKVKLSPIKTCLTCDIETTLIQSEGIYVCQKCGKFEYLIIKSEVPSHKDAINEKPKYPYKTINHLIERLNQFQAKQTTLIPSDIYNLIKFELKKKIQKSKKSVRKAKKHSS